MISFHYHKKKLNLQFPKRLIILDIFENNIDLLKNDRGNGIMIMVAKHTLDCLLQPAIIKTEF